MTRPSDSSLSSHALLERAKHTLQSLQYHEQAARYKAAAAALQAAMVHAENGRPEVLQQWLELESQSWKFGLESSELEPSKLEPSELEPSETELSELAADRTVSKRSIRIDQPIDRGLVDSPILDEAPHKSPWAKMEQAAAGRLSKLNENQNPSRDEQCIAIELVENKIASTQKDRIASVPDWISESNLERQTKPMRPMDWWRATPIWASIGVHVALLVCLGLVAITATKTPKLLSIVSSPVDSDNVLMESPMEMVSPLEELPDLSTALSSLPPSVPELTAGTAMDGFSLDMEKTTSEQNSIASAVSKEASESAKASKVGSQMIAGAEFFGAKATGNTFVYIVDSSPSMRRGGAFEAARQEIVRSLRSMKPTQRYFVSFFGKEIDPMILESGVVERFPIYAKPENLDKTIDWLGRVQVQKEGLPPNNALNEAITMQPDAIFLLFDGDTKVDVAKFLRRVNRSEDIINIDTPKVPIHVIHFFQEEFQAQMKRIADENGGTYRFVQRHERSTKGNR